MDKRIIGDNYHPEMQDGEFYVGNTRDDIADGYKWRTKRVGTVAYNRRGEIVSDMRPVFIQRQEWDAKRKRVAWRS